MSFIEEPENDRESVLEAKVELARRERDKFKRQLGRHEGTVKALEARIEELLHIDATPVRAPKWAKHAPRKKHQATAALLLSDWHFDEVVKPAELVGPTGEPLNAYSREIAEQRLERTFRGLLTVSYDLLDFQWDGLVLQLGGDMLSGNIHEEIKASNETSVIESVDYWIDPMVAGIKLLLENFPHIHIPCVVGNHGRNTFKPISKGRVTDNFDWLLYRQIWRYFQHDERITWNIPRSADAYWEVYGHNHLLSHGDQAKGGSGIAGLATPLALWDHRKRKRDQAAGGSFSHAWVGHFHTYMTQGRVTVNGSGKGTDEYAFIHNFGHEVPAQAFAVITPDHNVTFQAPIYSLDREKEGW